MFGNVFGAKKKHGKFSTKLNELNFFPVVFFFKPCSGWHEFVFEKKTTALKSTRGGRNR